jgi:hypothetical protein
VLRVRGSATVVVDTVFFFFYGWGWRKFRLSHFSLRDRLYSPLVFGSSIHPQRRSVPDSMRDLCERKEEAWARNGQPNFARQSDFRVIAVFFNMPQSCDMGQTALLPLQRKACFGFIRPKNPTASAGIEQGTRGQHANH